MTANPALDADGTYAPGSASEQGRLRRMGSRMRPFLAVLDRDGSTVAEVARAVYGQSTHGAIGAAQGALMRLQDVGMARCERGPTLVLWHRTAHGQAWLGHTDVADLGRVKYGAGMIDYGN